MLKQNKIVRKIFSNFRKDAAIVARVMETNFPQSNSLKFFEDIYTVRIKETEEARFNPDKLRFFEFETQDMVRGYLDAADAKKLNLISKKQKLVKNISASYYHAVADDLAEIVYASTLYPDAEIIINLQEIEPDIQRKHWDVIGFFLDCLKARGIKYTLINIAKFDVIYINNFAQLQFPFASGAKLDLLSDFFNDFITDKVKPFRKVFISRSDIRWKEDMEEAKTFSYPNDNRIDSHEAIEKLFESMGFQVVTSAQFKNFQEQVDFFSSVKILASLTSSGLANAIFMPPGGTVIEVATPLIVQSPLVDSETLKAYELDPKSFDIDINVVQEIHMFYHNLSLYKNHLYMSIPNMTRSTEEIEQFINDNPILKAFLNEPKSNNI